MGIRLASTRSTTLRSQYRQAQRPERDTRQHSDLCRLSKARVARFEIPSISDASWVLIPHSGGCSWGFPLRWSTPFRPFNTASG